MRVRAEADIDAGDLVEQLQILREAEMRQQYDQIDDVCYPADARSGAASPRARA